jgi:hypothetical protein
MAGQVVKCIACGHVGEPQIKGSIWITIILLFVFFPAAIVYEIWRRSGDKVCDECGNSNIQMYRPNPSSNQIQQQPFNNRVNRGRKKDSKIGLLLVAFVLFMLVAIIFIKPNDGYTPPVPVAEKKSQEYTAPTTTSSYQSSSTGSPSDLVSFDECKSKARSVLLSVAGTQYKSAVLVDSDLAYMARICTNDGSILITCSAPDQKMITTRSYDCPL